VTPGAYIAEVMEIVTVTPVAGGRVQLVVNRDDGTFVGTPTELSGVFAQDVSGNVAFTATASTNYAFLTGTVVENLDANSLLRNVSTGSVNDDLFTSHERGSVNFLNVGNTTVGGFQVNSGMTISAFYEYRSASKKRVNLGKYNPLLEWQVELEHRYPDGRYMLFNFHKVAVTPENTELAFEPRDWLGSDLTMDVLESSAPEHVDNPTGWVDIDNDPVTLQPVTDRTDSYSAGVYRLYMTPLNVSRALARGLPVERYDVGNVRTGNTGSPQEYLEHFAGLPQKKDKKILIQQEFVLTTTIEELSATNIALLFAGNIVDLGAGWLPANKLITVSQPPTTPNYTLAQVAHPLGAIMINAA
jgi:hypothetical protein